MNNSLENYVPHQSSFRDISGFVFFHDGQIHRRINDTYFNHYQFLIDSGLYKALINKNWLINHDEIQTSLFLEENCKILRPHQLQFISYPYEWSFSQLKDAALLTLAIQEKTLEYGMTLKDASAYNIQFEQGKPIFIDTLSFEIYEEGKPWDAYLQFCQHFLAPLALMSKIDVRLGQFLKNYIDGIPLDLASSLLNKQSWLNPGILTHIHLHARMQKTHAATDKPKQSDASKRPKLSKNGLKGIISSLRNTIKKLDWKPAGTEWANYYHSTNYTHSSFEIKGKLVEKYLKLISPITVWDLGANTGHFSRIAKSNGAKMVIAFDIDPAAVELNYRQLKEKKQTSPLPLLLDLTNPSPGLGWHNKERDSLINRSPADCIMALALIHHLAISNNIPLGRIAKLFAQLSPNLIIEFVPKSDSQVKRLLQSRKDIFAEYTKEGFEKAFSTYFTIGCAEEVEGSERTLYLMMRKDQY